MAEPAPADLQRARAADFVYDRATPEPFYGLTRNDPGHPEGDFVAVEVHRGNIVIGNNVLYGYLSDLVIADDIILDESHHLIEHDMPTTLAMRQRIDDSLAALLFSTVGAVEKCATASSKAEALLRAHLSPMQRDELDRQGSFVALGSESKTKYLICYTPTYNVISDRLGRLCAVAPDLHLPVYDLMLAQKLLIETDEQAYLRVANRGLQVNPRVRSPACGLRIEASDNFEGFGDHDGGRYGINYGLLAGASVFLAVTLLVLAFG